MYSASDRLCRVAALVLAVAGSGWPAYVAFAVPPGAGPAEQAPPPQSDLSRHVLRVCADPNNLPFSNARGEGFENALARMIAEDLGWRLEYVWWPQRRGFVRNTLRARRCDVIVGVPAGYELTATTLPYYRSTYAFVTRRDGGVVIRSFDDPRLRRLTIGVHLIGDDYANVPPAQSLAARGLVGQVRGYSIYGDYSRPDPPRALIDAVAHGDVDVAVAWGPTAGFFARREPVALAVEPAVDERMPMQFSIAMGVRRGDDALRRLLDRFLERRRGDVSELLASYGVPLVAIPASESRR